MSRPESRVVVGRVRLARPCNLTILGLAQGSLQMRMRQNIVKE